MGRLLSALRRRRVDAFLCARMTNIRYLTGFGGSDAVLVVSPRGAVLMTDGRYAEQARAEVAGAEVVIADRKWDEAARRIRRLGASRIGFEALHLPVAVFRRVARGREEAWAPLQDPVGDLRMRKDDGEIRAMERAAAVAAGALLAVLSEGLAGRSEAGLAADLERRMKHLGAEETSFRTIVASGPRSSLPHAVPTGAPIERGGPTLIDFGAKVRGYCSDETVTFLPERPPRVLRRAFDAVRRAQEIGIRTVRPGFLCRDVDARVRESLDRAGFLKYFVHSTGHGVGLDIHERPSLSPRSRDRLAEGMVVTVEPGIYIPGEGGVRLEDMVRVTARGGERVTYLPKKPSIPA